MEAFLIYIIKASGVLILFHAAYELLLKKETFFNINRVFLLSGLLMAMVLPSIVIENYTVLPVSELTAYPIKGSGEISENGLVASSVNLIGIIQTIFLIGFGVMVFRIFVQLMSIRRLIRINRLIKVPGFTLVEMQKELAPFSFFNYIFYNPKQFSEGELEAILEHEKIHCQQWHSADILIAQLLLALLWLNPLSWLYIKNIKQNLEFLADSKASKHVSSRKTYEYTMLKLSGNLKAIPVTNSFYNSLIKKRIVMLHQSKSNKLNVLKTLIILPVLALFLWSFNTRTIYVSSESSKQSIINESSADQTIEIQIDKDTSNEELEELKKDLSKKGIDFSYTVVHNEQKEIVDLDISFSGGDKGSKTFVGSSSFNNDGKPIDPVTIVFDQDNNIFFMGNDGEEVKIIETEKNISTWVHSDDDTHQTIEIYKDDGEEEIRVNGKKVTRKELEKMEKQGKLHKKHVKIEKEVKGDKAHKIMIISDHDSEHDVEVISSDQPGFLFLGDELDDDWLILLDGKEVKKEDIKNLEPDDIETMNMIKGEKASEKYRKKAKGGVLEITTKN